MRAQKREPEKKPGTAESETAWSPRTKPLLSPRGASAASAKKKGKKSALGYLGAERRRGERWRSSAKPGTQRSVRRDGAGRAQTRELVRGAALDELCEEASRGEKANEIAPPGSVASLGYSERESKKKDLQCKS